MPDHTSRPLHVALVTVGTFFWELIKVFLLAIAIIVPIRYYLIQPFFVRGASMEPTFADGEYLVIDELSYQMRSPQRGEVVVFRYPQDPSQYFIKRIIGLPGEDVLISGGQVVIHNTDHPQGVILDESGYLPAETRTSGPAHITLQANQYFVLGDNRAASSDSRSWGALPRNLIVGRVWVRAFPFERWHLFSLMRPGFVNL